MTSRRGGGEGESGGHRGLSLPQDSSLQVLAGPFSPGLLSLTGSTTSKSSRLSETRDGSSGGEYDGSDACSGMRNQQQQQHEEGAMIRPCSPDGDPEYLQLLWKRCHC